MKQFVFLFSLSFFLNCISFVTLKPNLQEVDLGKIKIENIESILLYVIHDFEINNKKNKSYSKVDENEIEFYRQILKESKFFSNVEKGLVKTDKKLIITVKGNINVNMPLYYLSFFTLNIIPYNTNRDLEFTFSFGEKSETILECKRSVQIQTWVQLFLLPYSIFNLITKKDQWHFEHITKSVLEEAYRKGVFK